MWDMRSSSRRDRVWYVVFSGGLLVGLVLLLVVLAAKGVGQANEWAGVLGAVVTLTAGLVSLVNWRSKKEAGEKLPARSDQPVLAPENQGGEREQGRIRADLPEATTQQPLRRWLPRWRVAALPVILCLVVLSGIGLGTGFGVHALTSARSAALVGVPPLPTTVGPIALTGDQRAADPCALINLAWLRQFGNPRFVTPQLIADCAVQITTPNGDNATLDVVYRMAVPSVAKIGGQAQRLGALTILRKRVLRSPWATYCQNMVVLADNTPVEIDAFGGKGFDVCKLAEVGTATAVNALADHGITYSPGRTADWPIARIDACTVLTDPELSTLGGVDPAIRTPGYANWLCQWGPPNAFVQVWFRLDRADIGPNNYGNPTTIADRRAWLKPVTYVNPHQCIATVVSRPAQSPTDATEMIQVTTQAAVSDQTLCTRASDLAARAVTRVPS